MTTFVSKMLSQTDKIPILHHASAWLPGTNEKPSEEYECSSRYSIAPPSYENVVQEKLDNSRLGNTLSTIWKRASFSSYSHEERKPEECPNEMLIDKKQIDHAATLINVATDMNNSGHQQMAIDLYMMGLDKLIDALPLETSPTVKLSLERKLIELQQHHQLNLSQKKEDDNTKEENPTEAHMAHLVVQAAVLSAVALKKSPIPDALSSVMNYAAESVQSMDQKHQIRKRTWDLITLGVTKAVEMDRQYEIHQMVTGAVRTGLTAFVKAGMAYAETPGPHDELNKKK